MFELIRRQSMSYYVSYLEPAFDLSMRDAIIQEAINVLGRHSPCFQAIAFRGMSGAMIAPILAHVLRKELILVRKREPETHSCRIVEGFSAPCKYVIVDDQIDTGNTLRTIIDDVYSWFPEHSPYGIYLYNEIMYRFDSKYYNKQDFNDIPVLNRSKREVF